MSSRLRAFQDTPAAGSPSLETAKSPAQRRGGAIIYAVLLRVLFAVAIGAGVIALYGWLDPLAAPGSKPLLMPVTLLSSALLLVITRAPTEPPTRSR